ncbi:MAG: inositol monophosphatase family protein, partial [Candidatus Nanopelagicaceae bacterium]
MSKTGTQLSPSELSLLLSPELQRAHRLADAADAISLSRYLAIDLVVETKPDTTPVTDADRAVERSIRAILEQDAPRDLIIGEEFGGKELLETAEPGTRFWIIDPIDGTKNFLRGIPTWATLIAHGQITSDGKKVIDRGVVSAPALGRRWWAERGNGSYVTENFAPASPLSIVQTLASQTPTSQTPKTPSENSTT